MDAEILPQYSADFLSEEEALALDILAYVKKDPERAAMLADIFMKRQVSNERLGWIMRARMVYTIVEEQIWSYHPGLFSSYSEFFMQPEIDIPPSVVSDMIAICKYATPLAKVGIDVWDVIMKAGHSKVRQIIPMIREADRAGVLVEQVGPIIDALEQTSFRELINNTKMSNVRTSYDLEAFYAESLDGRISVSFRDLDIDDLEHLALTLKIKRWFDTQGNRIEPPLEEQLKALKA